MNEIRWRALAWESHERLQLTTGADGTVAQSELAGVAEEGARFGIQYSIKLASDWRVLAARIESQLDRAHRIEQHRDGKDRWSDGEGKHLEEFDGCRFIDISLSPFTNTLPIRHLTFEDGVPQTIDVIFIDLPAFTMHRATQFYTRVSSHRYRFQDVDHPGFVADIVVDDDGLVVDYPELFTRE